MSKKSQATARKLRSSYVTTTISISLVLLLLGIIGLLLLNTGRLTSYVKENLGLTVLLNDDAREAEIRKIEKSLSVSSIVKSVEYIDKEQAAEILQQDLGEDFISFLGYNPLPSSLEVKMYAEYATPESMEQMKKLILDFPEVKEVHYQKDMVSLIHENVSKISAVLLAFAALMMIMAISLINNTVRLMVYSKRFLIHTMQLVGATNSFVRRPFISTSIIQGLTGGLIANLLLSAIIYISARELDGVISFSNIYVITLLFAGVFAVGIIITLLSTTVSVNRYLNVRTADLYV
ncbi:MAG: permease-like cell division protein FtsX [Marinilabiliaceae bacterium]|jgi:cell division transport system permease protein|nr:FtsX-like permease family protein [Bacteroidales bacterium]MCR5696926.1 permease-like cell division protein FtsX [Marinilabiliaceae bacterium]